MAFWPNLQRGPTPLLLLLRRRTFFYLSPPSLTDSPPPHTHLTRDMSDTAKHPIAPVEPETSTATQERAPGVQLKVREENVSQGDERGETREGGREGG